MRNIFRQLIESVPQGPPAKPDFKRQAFQDVPDTE